MKIDLQSNYGAYRKTIGKETAPVKTEAEAHGNAGKVDVVEFSHGSGTADKTMRSLKAGIQSHISAPASSERLEALRESIKSGSYRISTDDLVDSIFGV